MPPASVSWPGSEPPWPSTAPPTRRASARRRGQGDDQLGALFTCLGSGTARPSRRDPERSRGGVDRTGGRARREVERDHGRPLAPDRGALGTAEPSRRPGAFASRGSRCDECRHHVPRAVRPITVVPFRTAPFSPFPTATCPAAPLDPPALRRDAHAPARERSRAPPGRDGCRQEQLARVLHASSPRRHGPFVAVNCAAIPAELLESEMFGIGKGVATGVTEASGPVPARPRRHPFPGQRSPTCRSPCRAKLLRALQGRGDPARGWPAHSRGHARRDRDERGPGRQDGTGPVPPRRLLPRGAASCCASRPCASAGRTLPGSRTSCSALFAQETAKSLPGFTGEAAAPSRPAAGPATCGSWSTRSAGWPTSVGRTARGRSACFSEHVLATDWEASVPPSALDLAANVAQLERRLIQAAIVRAPEQRSRAARLLGVSSQRGWR